MLLYDTDKYTIITTPLELPVAASLCTKPEDNYQICLDDQDTAGLR